MTSISPVPDWARSFSCTICPERKKHIAPPLGCGYHLLHLLQICHLAGVDDFFTSSEVVGIREADDEERPS